MAALSGTNTLTAPRWQAGMEYTAIGSYTLVGSIASGDTITWTGLLPTTSNPVQILEFRIFGQELDTNASPTATLIVGDGTTTNGYLTSKTAGDANGQLQFFGDGSFIGTKVTGTSGPASANVVATVGGSVATAASSGTVYVMVRCFCAN